jgi:hypothetical protein
MGRPPIGKVAMTSTERVHRFRAKHRQDKPETKPETKQSAALEARVHELEAELARERQRREATEAKPTVLDAAAVKHFSEKGALRIEDAIRVHKARLDKQFEQRVNDEVRRRIDAANDSVRANNTELRAEIWRLTRFVQQRAVFTETQYRQMLMLCHPDNSASPKLRAELLRILVDYKIRLTGAADKDKARRTAKR